MTVKFFALDGKKYVARLRLPRVNADVINQRLWRTGFEFGIAGIRDKFYRERFHNIISTKTSQ